MLYETAWVEFISLKLQPVLVNIIVYCWAVKSSEFKRWLTGLGATFTPAKGSYFRVMLNGKLSILPMHQKELPKGTVEAIKKQLGLKSGAYSESRVAFICVPNLGMCSMRLSIECNGGHGVAVLKIQECHTVIVRRLLWYFGVFRKEGCRGLEKDAARVLRLPLC